MMRITGRKVKYEKLMGECLSMVRTHRMCESFITSPLKYIINIYALKYIFKSE